MPLKRWDLQIVNRSFGVNMESDREMREAPAGEYIETHDVMALLDDIADLVRAIDRGVGEDESVAAIEQILKMIKDA